ncbi:MAG: GNAT family protein [Planctomycetota bacterium]
MSRLEPRKVELPDESIVTLCSPTPDDAEKLIAYLDTIRRESQGIMFSPEDDLPSVEWERDWIEQRNANPQNLMLGAWSGDRLIGLGNVSGGGKFARAQHRAELGISLSREWWGRGLGTRLLETLIEFAVADESIHVLRLCVYSFNQRAIKLYERCGFEREGARRWSVRFSDGTYADEIQMSRWVGPTTTPASRTHDPLLRTSHD